MRYKLNVFEPIGDADPWGEEAAGYRKTGTIHAERVKFSGSRSDEVRDTSPTTGPSSTFATLTRSRKTGEWSSSAGISTQ